MTSSSAWQPVWWTDGTRRIALVLGLLLSGGLIVAGWSSRTGLAVTTRPPPKLILDPNTAPPELLMALPGLGPGLIRNWVEARDERPFETLDDIERRVRGIGPATLNRIAPYLQIGKSPPE